MCREHTDDFARSSGAPGCWNIGSAKVVTVKAAGLVSVEPMLRGRSIKSGPSRDAAVRVPGSNNARAYDSSQIFLAAGCLLPAVIIYAFVRREALGLIVGPLFLQTRGETNQQLIAAAASLPLRATAMEGSAVKYSDAALAQAQKDGSSYLGVLQKAGLVGQFRDVRITAVSTAADRDSPSSGLLEEGTGKILHLIRHGQGYHNLLGELYQEMGIEFSSTGDDLSSRNPYRREEVLDPPLTEVGRNQAKALRPITKHLSPEMVVVSPLSRATQTALLAFPHLLGSHPGDAPKVPFVCHEGVREQTGAHVCDRCRGLEDMLLEFPMVDYSSLEYINATADLTWSENRESMASMVERAYNFMLWLRDRPEKEVAVASHSAFLFVLVNSVIDTGMLADGLSSWFMTGEMRSLIVSYND